MAYNRTFNPDALPAHAEPEEAAQKLSALSANRRLSPSQPPITSPNQASQPHRTSPSNTRPYQSPVQTPQQYSQGYSNKPSNTAPQSYYSQNSAARLGSPPPPQNYGFGPPPSDPTSQRPPPISRPPRTPNPPDVDGDSLFPLFRAANSSQSGSLSEQELGSALVNGDYTSFDPWTIKMMMKMFDKTGRGSIDWDEFRALWRFLAAWRELFERFDEDGSGRISVQEFGKALVAFGYRLSQPFVAVLFNAYNRGSGSQRPGAQGMSFDLFVQACISLKRMTDAFKGYDDDRDGFVTLSFEEFLTEIIKLKE